MARPSCRRTRRRGGAFRDVFVPQDESAASLGALAYADRPVRAIRRASERADDRACALLPDVADGLGDAGGLDARAAAGERGSSARRAAAARDLRARSLRPTTSSESTPSSRRPAASARAAPAPPTSRSWAGRPAKAATSSARCSKRACSSRAAACCSFRRTPTFPRRRSARWSPGTARARPRGRCTRRCRCCARAG